MASAATTFNTSNQTWRQLFGNGTTYVVPKFQRDYSWTQDQWDDLWQDIQAMRLEGGDPSHYMGYLVLQAKDDKSFEVIDGQQRLTTLSLMALAVIRALQRLVDQGVDAEDNRRRIEQLRNVYIGYLDPVTLVAKPKLALNRNNDAYYQQYIVPLQNLPQRNLRSSERLLRSAFEWLCRKVTDEGGVASDGAKLAKFLDELSDRLFFTVVTVTDELNAFRVFERLNARGVRLSPTDLLKNYLFSVVSREGSHPGEIDALEKRWEGMVDQLGSERFPDFLRAHWNSRRKLIRETDLFKAIREQTRDRQAVFQLIRQMDEDIGTYVALSDPEDPLWNQPERLHARELRMFSVRQPWPMLMAARRMLALNSSQTTGEFAELLRACSIISFRYNVIGGLATNELERVYNSVAQQITEGRLKTGAEIIRALAGIYVPDTQFRPAFEEKALKTTNARNSSVVRYILFAIEAAVSGRDFDEESSRYTIEHILPENPDDGWEAFSETGQTDSAVYRLGNMTLLEEKFNKQAGNSSFRAKCDVYRKSEFAITRRIAEENSDWNLERLRTRQKAMAKSATGIWKLSQLESP
jgi:hypothetical protein